ncbi:MAG TPA: cupin domain-containing protein [Actinomycetota bacterium]|jgi:quercetin dioxygenase-like cupin family protein|nr:cupin domain-containing protein [Actinomycetota bacterium]
MGKRRVALLSGALIAAALIAVGIVPSAAQEPPPPIATEFLSGRAAFTDDVDLMIRNKVGGTRTEVVRSEDPSRTVVARFTVQPGAQFPWHSHAGPVVVNMVQGTLVYIETDCGEHAYPAGTAFVDPGHGHVHSAVNEGEEAVVLVATFFEAPAEGSLLIPAETPTCAA